MSQLYPVYRFLLWTVLCLGTPAAFAQQLAPAAASSVSSEPSAEPHFTHVIDSLLQNVSKLSVPGRILYDRTPPTAMLHVFSQGRVDTSFSEHFQQAYQELYTAAYTRATFPLTPEQLMQQAQHPRLTAPARLAVLDYRFGVLDTAAVDAGTLEFRNGLYYESRRNFSSPFKTRDLTLAAALADSLPQTTRLQLTSALCLGNQGRTVANVQVQVGTNGPTVLCLPDQVVSAVFAGTGLQVLRYTVQFTDGSSTQAASAVWVVPNPPAARDPNLTLFVRSRDTFTNYEQTERIAGEGNAGIWLHNPASVTDRKLRHPIIVLDGIDDRDERDLIEIYTEQLPGLTQLINNQNSPANQANRDLVILNFPKNERTAIATSGGLSSLKTVDGGDDYIERNALALIELINELKPRLADPNEKFTIIGPSMGGMISRYALAYMEKEYARTGDPYWNHQTDTWISFDAPHQGANVPIGIQAYVEYLKFTSGAGQLYNDNLLSPASRQLILSHVLAGEGTALGAPGYRDRFMLAMRDNGLPGSMGYPLHVRRVALANGSLSGVPRPEGAGSRTLKMRGRIRWPYMVAYFAAASVAPALFFLPIRSDGEFLETDVNFAPGPNSSCTVFHGRLKLGLRQLSGIGGIISLPVRNRSFRAISGAHGSFDLAPGGYYDAQRRAKIAGEQADNGWWKGRISPFDLKFTDMKEFHSFISPVSALGYNYQALNNYQNTQSLPSPYQNLATQNLVCTGQTPFDAYYAPQSINTEHVTLSDAGMQQFLGLELFRVTPAPVFLQAPTALCPNGGTSTFQVQGECSRLGSNGQPLFPITYTWTLTGPAVFAGNTGQSISGPATQQTIRSTATEGDVVLTVTAQRGGFGISAPVVYSIRVFAPAVSIWTDAGGPVCMGQLVRVDLSGFNTQGPTRWFVSNGNLNAATDTYALVEAGSGLTEVRAEQTSACDGRVISSNTATVDGSGNGPNGLPCSVRVLPPPPVAYQFYPNPADSYLEVSATAGTQEAFKAVLYNGAGRPVEQALGTRGTARLRTAHLPAGLYHLVVTHGQQTERYNLAISH